MWDEHLASDALFACLFDSTAPSSVMIIGGVMIVAAATDVPAAGVTTPAAPAHTNDPHLVYTGNKKLARQAHETDNSDIHHDHQTLYLLRTGKFHTDTTTQAQIRRVTHRAKRYRLEPQLNGPELVWRIMADGSRRLVPSPDERRAVVQRAHTHTGHWGVRRTSHLLLADYWWRGILKDTATVVSECEVCSRVHAAFNAQSPTLKPLDIVGLFYRWGVDLCGPFPTTQFGHRYVMVCVEHYSRTLVLTAIPAKEAKHTAYAFEQHVLGRYGGCAEVLTDQGTEWQGEFADCLARNFIDHRTTAPLHPQANGLAERCVQTVKRSLRRQVEDTMTADTWDKHLAYISLGYNCSKQASTGYAPFQLLYARNPFVPSTVASRMEPPLNLNSADAAVQDRVADELLRRAGYLATAMPTVASNLAIAQHRDTLRYARVRSGAYRPVVRKFEVGDFVYLRRSNMASTLQIQAKQTILQVVEVYDTGSLLLRGRCGCTIRNHITNVAPCHLPNIDPTICPEMARPGLYHACEMCNMPDDEGMMLLCDSCGAAWHTYCLPKPLSAVPTGIWVCPACTDTGVTTQQVAIAQKTRAGRVVRSKQETDKLFADSKSRSRVAQAKLLDGRLVLSKPKVTTKGKAADPPIWGITAFRGADMDPPFLVSYDDGSTETITLADLKARNPLPRGSERPTHPVNAHLQLCTKRRCKHPAHALLG